MTRFGAAAFALVLTFVSFVRRISGRAAVFFKKQAQPAGRSLQQLWWNWGMLVFVLDGASRHGFEASRLLWLGGAVGCAFLGWWLEKNGRK